MALNSAHEGYEYQDLLTAYYILKEILKESKSQFIIDRKETEEDKFDDLTIINESRIEKKQIKYSNEESNHTLQKKELSTTSYDLHIDGLFKAWKSYSNKKQTELRLCLSWNNPESEDEILDVLIEDETSSKSFSKTKIYKIDPDKLWSEDSKPLGTWRRFRRESQEINRDLFKNFCKDFLIEVELPKASIDIYIPGKLENYTLELVKKIGVGKYPNNHISVEEALLGLIHKIKNARAKGVKLTTQDILYSAMHLKTNYGNIHQDFEIDNDVNVDRSKVNKIFLKKVFNNNKTVLFGPPGSGKSWFIQNFMDLLLQENIKFIKHYCYVDLNDEYYVERIKTNVFYANLINDIIDKFPHLKSVKPTLYGSDLYELEVLLENIEEEVVLIIDGLDHIERIYNLKNNLLSGNEIKIIEKILKIDFPNNIKVLISTQPLKKEEFKMKGYTIENIPGWDKRNALELMDKFEVEDLKIRRDLYLSEKLLKKSQGNPLYLSYLIKEVKKMNILTEETINMLPDYSFNLSNYYEYLLTKLDERDDIICALCGVNFSLTRSELREITYSGDYVENSLNVLEPVIKENYSTGGIIIYHESFRRFIIEKLKQNRVPIKQKIYRNIIEWFERKDFFDYLKAFRNFLNVLLEAGDYSKILSYLDKDYIINSLFYGHSKGLIIKNYKLFLKASVELNDFPNLVLLSELGRILSSTEVEFENIQELYFKSLAEINGYDKLKELLVYEGQANLDINSGLKICYLCSRNEIVPEWDIYLPKRREEINLEEFKYFVRASLDLNKQDKIDEMIIKLENDDYDEFRKIFIKEYIDYYDFENLKERVLKLEDEIWKEYLEAYAKGRESRERYQEISRDILAIEMVSDDEKRIIKNLFKQIDYFIENDLDKVSQFKDDISSINWFYNWIIFVIEIKKLENNIKKGILSNEDIETRVVSVYLYLTENTKPFLKKPRTCDLYSIKPLILRTIKEPLNYIKSKDVWNQILDILKEVSYETTTSIRGSITGPLSTNVFLELLEEIVNEINLEKITEIFNEMIEEEKEYRFYEYLTEYNLRLSIIYSKMNKQDKAQKIFKEALKYHTAYTFRKDITLSELLDSINSLNNLKESLGNKYIYKLKFLADTVVNHTDGRSTKHYPISWYRELIKINLKDALLYIRKELLEHNVYWILEESLIKLMFLGGDISPIIESFILKTFPAECDEEFLIAYKKNIEKLYSIDKMLAKLSFDDFLNRIEFNKKLKLDKTIISFIEDYRIKFNLNDLSNLELKFKSEKEYDFSNDKWYEKLNKSIISRKNMRDMSIIEITKYYSKRILKKKEINSLIYYLENLEELNCEVKLLIDILVLNEISILERRNHLKNLKIVFRNMETKDGIYAYANMSLYCYLDDGWYSKFVEKDLFKSSYDKNNEIALKTFFKHAYNRLKEPEYFHGVGSNIINALVESKYDESEIFNIWDNLYEIINYRLPGQIDYDWESALENNLEMNKEELLICILLTRLKHGEVNRQKWVLSGIRYLLKNEKEKLIKPLKWFIKNKDDFLEISFVLVLQLVWETTKVDFKYRKLFSKELYSIYPTENFMINHMIQEILDFYEEDEIPINIPSNEFELNKEKKEFVLSENIRNRFLNHHGLNMENVIKNYCYDILNPDFRDKIGKLYFNQSNKLMVKNMYFANKMLININKELQDYFNKYSWLGGYNSRELFDNINFDLNTIIAQHNSLIIRPSDLKVPSQYNTGKIFNNNISKKDNWVRVGYYEKETKIEHFQEAIPEKIHILYQGIIFNKEEMDFPYFKRPLDTKCIWEYYWYLKRADEIKDNIIMANIEFDKDMFESHKILWLSPNILSALELQMRDPEKGLRAYNSKGEDVLIYNRWDTNYVGYEYLTDEVPRLEGSELLLREDYFKKICELSKEEPRNFIFKF